MRSQVPRYLRAINSEELLTVAFNVRNGTTRVTLSATQFLWLLLLTDTDSHYSYAVGGPGLTLSFLAQVNIFKQINICRFN